MTSGERITEGISAETLSGIFVLKRRTPGYKAMLVVLGLACLGAFAYFAPTILPIISDVYKFVRDPDPNDQVFKQPGSAVPAVLFFLLIVFAWLAAGVYGIASTLSALFSPTGVSFHGLAIREGKVGLGRVTARRLKTVAGEEWITEDAMWVGHDEQSLPVPVQLTLRTRADNSAKEGFDFHRVTTIGKTERASLASHSASFETLVAVKGGKLRELSSATPDTLRAIAAALDHTDGVRCSLKLETKKGAPLLTMHLGLLGGVVEGAWRSFREGGVRESAREGRLPDSELNAVFAELVDSYGWSIE